MSSTRWKVLTAYLPGIASVVNSFHSPEVQLAVYQSLIEALDEKTAAEEEQAAKSRSSRPKTTTRETASAGQDAELVYDLVEGESIHSLVGK